MLETNDPFRLALADRILALADDEIILAHRNSEWTGHGPILEEDIAFSNIAQDELGHATLWYVIYEDLSGKSPDEMVFFREPAGFRNIQMVELPRGDWAFSMLRQYLFDSAEMVQLAFLVESSYDPIAETAAKVRREEIYHLRHTSNWVKRLGLGTEESNQRMQRALEVLWPIAQQLFVPLPGEELLVDQGIVGDPAARAARWKEIVQAHLVASGLEISSQKSGPCLSRYDHTEHLSALLEEMQSVARMDPEAEW